MEDYIPPKFVAFERSGEHQFALSADGLIFSRHLRVEAHNTRKWSPWKLDSNIQEEAGK